MSEICLGTMWFGTTTAEDTSLELLDRFIEAGGTMLDTSNNYSYWAPGASGGESEALLGRWLADRGVRDRVVLSTKVGAQPTIPGSTYFESPEGLSAPAVRKALEGSLHRLGTDHVDVYWAHIEDRKTPLRETVDVFASLVEEGKVGAMGASNHAIWKVERARNLAGGRPAYTNLQLRHSYLRPRLDAREPGDHLFADASDEVLDYVRNEPDMRLWAYSPLLKGGYAGKPLDSVYDHPGTPARLAALHAVAEEAGATPNQVVIAWLLAHDVVPIVGVSSLAQLDEALAARDLKLDEAAVQRLDGVTGL